MKVGIVLPTVDGRESVFERVFAAYGETRPTGTEFEFSIPENYPTVGAAWNAGADLDCDYLFFAIDDAEPHHGWCQAAVETVDSGYIPAPRLERPDGSVESCGSMGFGMLLPECADWTPCRNAGLVFVKQEWYSGVGEFLPIHFAADDDWCWRAALHGHPLRYRERVRFTHHHETLGSQRVRDNAQSDIQACVSHMATLKVPVYW
jgi:hypothetical protein